CTPVSFDVSKRTRGRIPQQRCVVICNPRGIEGYERPCHGSVIGSIVWIISTHVLEQTDRGVVVITVVEELCNGRPYAYPQRQRQCERKYEQREQRRFPTGTDNAQNTVAKYHRCPISPEE